MTDLQFKTCGFAKWKKKKNSDEKLNFQWKHFFGGGGGANILQVYRLT